MSLEHSADRGIFVYPTKQAATRAGEELRAQLRDPESWRVCTGRLYGGRNSGHFQMYLSRAEGGVILLRWGDKFLIIFTLDSDFNESLVKTDSDDAAEISGEMRFSVVRSVPQDAVDALTAFAKESLHAMVGVIDRL